MANSLLEWFPPNRLATFPEFHNLKGIPQIFICPPMVEFKTALVVHQDIGWCREGEN